MLSASATPSTTTSSECRGGVAKKDLTRWRSGERERQSRGLALRSPRLKMPNVGYSVQSTYST